MARGLMQMVIWIVPTVALLALALWYLRRKPSVEGMQDGKSPKHHVYYFFMPSCGYCNQFNPEWDIFVQKMKGDSSVALHKIDISDPSNAEQTDKFSVSGVPDIRLVSEKKEHKYGGERKADALLEAVKCLKSSNPDSCMS
jgi:hypothetical protein